MSAGDLQNTSNVEEEELEQIQLVCTTDHTPYCPIQDIDHNLFVVNNNGDVYSVEDGRTQVAFTTNGQPTSIIFDQEGNSFIADGAHQAILSQTIQENRVETTPIIKDYEGMPLKGPHSLVLSQKNNILFFTDSGPFGETSLENATGSLFAIDLGESILKPVIHGQLAFPTGVALDESENVIYMSETAKNRIMKVVHLNGQYYSSVFKQLSGRFGPTAIARDPNSDLLYVARFEFEQITNDGLISIYDSKGELQDEIEVPGYPEISGLYFSKAEDNVLYVTERSKKALLKVLV